MQNKLTGVFFLLCFILPIIVSWVALQFNWQNKQTLNSGEFLNTTIVIDNWHRYSKKNFSIGYFIPEECHSDCSHQQKLIHNAYTGLGKKANKVELLSFNSEQQLDIVTMMQEKVTFDIHSYIYVINQQGLLVLRYPLNGKSLITTLQGMQKDIKKLLNYSRSNRQLYVKNAG